MLRQLIVISAFAAAVIFLGGCNSNCDSSCDNSDDCGGGLVCLSSTCVPEECADCGGYISLCYYNRVSCDFIRCD
ncbi:MAG: hypothetical protein ABIJ56_12550 [Pseudomonadota bacterium]